MCRASGEGAGKAFGETRSAGEDLIMVKELLRTHDTKAAGYTPEINWHCQRLRLKTSEYPCDARKVKNPKECEGCLGAQRLTPRRPGRPRKIPQTAVPQQEPDKAATKTNKTPADKQCAFDKTRICDGTCCAFEETGRYVKCLRGGFQLWNN